MIFHRDSASPQFSFLCTSLSSHLLCRLRFGLLGTGGDSERRWWVGVFPHAMACTLPFLQWLTIRAFIILAFKMSFPFSTLRIREIFSLNKRKIENAEMQLPCFESIISLGS